MSRTEIDVDRPPAEVYRLLLDPAAYVQWVVGARRLRGIDPAWPQPGTRFYHEVGVWPLVLRDNTKLLEAVPDERVVLEARLRPAGVATVSVSLEPRGSGTHVTLYEEAACGPLDRVPRAVLEPLVTVRNAWALRRLKRLAEGRPAGERLAG
jgi:uncharacterized protein YndB with AHSA1/START domain